MNVDLKINGALLDGTRADLDRRHAFAHERVGFLTAGAAWTRAGLLLTVRGYRPVADEDYEYAPRVGAKIGSAAMRKAVQWAFRPPSTLLHVHTHKGSGRPQFSGVDLESARAFVPGFFGPTPRMPHGLLVLSDNSVAGLLWLGEDRPPVEIDTFTRIDAPLRRDWEAA